MNARMLCHYTSFAEVVNAALGGGSAATSKPEDYEDLSKAPTVDAAIANINAALKFG